MKDLTPIELEHRALAAADAHDVLLELAADAELRGAYTLHAISRRLKKSFSVVQRLFDPLSGRALSEHTVAAIGVEFATRFYRRRLARFAAAGLAPAVDPRYLALSLTVGVGITAAEAERSMADKHCSSAEWRKVASCCGAIAGDAARAEAAALAAADAGDAR